MSTVRERRDDSIPRGQESNGGRPDGRRDAAIAQGVVTPGDPANRRASSVAPPADGASRIVSWDGRPLYGVSDGSIREADPSAAAGRGPLGALRRRLREKAWVYLGIYGRDLVSGLAVVDAGYLGTSFAYLFDRADRTLRGFEGQSPLAMAVRVDRHTAHGLVSWERGAERLVIESDDRVGQRRVHGRLPVGREELAIDLVIDDDLEAVVPLQVVRPRDKATQAWSFTHKAAGLPVRGTIVVRAAGGRRVRELTLDPSRDRVAIDFTAGYPAYDTTWEWASLAGFAADAAGTPVGLNLVTPIHHPVWNENAFWIDGRRVPVGVTRFDRPAEGASDQTWRIVTEDGRVDLVFRPEGERAETIDLKIVASRFRQPIGAFSGTLRDESGASWSIEGVPGVCEHHVARW